MYVNIYLIYIYFECLDTSENGEGDGEKEGINKCFDWFKYGNMFDENIVPKKSKNEGANKNGKQ